MGNLVKLTKRPISVTIPKKGCDTLAKTELKREDKLVELIRTDSKLQVDQRFEYIILAQNFAEDFRNNMMLSSIDLDAKYKFGMDVWQEFLSYPAVSKYITSFRNELINRNTDMALATGEGVRDAIGVKKAMKEEGGEVKNSNFVVFRLPDKEDEYQLTGQVT